MCLTLYFCWTALFCVAAEIAFFMLKGLGELRVD